MLSNTKVATVAGALNPGASSTGVFCVRLETPASSPDLNPANNVYVVGNPVKLC